MLNYGLALSPSFLWYKLHVVLQIYAGAMMLKLIIPSLTGWIVRAAIAATLFLLHVRLVMSEVYAEIQPIWFVNALVVFSFTTVSVTN